MTQGCPRGRDMPRFRLRFGIRKLRKLIAQYGPGPKEDAALAAGRRILAGEYTGENLEIIIKWKNKRHAADRFLKNREEEIRDALAVGAKTERSAIAVLLGLNGVRTPVASAILTAIDPTRYTILDFRALESLGNKSKDRSVHFYLVYLDACRMLASAHGVSLRDFDRALWHWSDEQSKRRQSSQ